MSNPTFGVTHLEHGSEVLTSRTKNHFVTEDFILFFLVTFNDDLQVTHKVQIEQTCKRGDECFNFLVLNQRIKTTLERYFQSRTLSIGSKLYTSHFIIAVLYCASVASGALF